MGSGAAVTCAVLIALWQGGCGSQADATDPLQFSSIHDGDYLGGPQTSSLDITSSRFVERTELYLDGQRIATDELAPFAPSWDARDFADGSHELVARADLDDGEQLTHTIEILIDNTPPGLADIPTSATAGQPFRVEATDNGVVARIEISRGVPGESPAVLTAPPYELDWPWGCGPASISVRVVDAAGGETTRAAIVTGIDPQDVDCDLHVSQAFGGDDCNDLDPEIHPGAIEQRDLKDRNCNGLLGAFDGVDLDHDGVISVASGGTDCDDSDPAIHGAVLVYSDTPVVADGQVVTWSPGDATFSSDFGSSQLFLSRAGRVDHLVAGSSGNTLEQLASGANAGSIGATDDFVAFGRGTQLVILNRDLDQHWISHATLDASGPVGRLAYARDRTTSVEALVFQAGTTVFFASNATGEWVVQSLVDAKEPLAQSPVLTSGLSSFTIAFRTAHAAWAASAYPQRTPPSVFTHELGPSGAVPTALMSINTASLVAVVQSDGSGLVFQDGISSPVLTLPSRVTAMFLDYPYLFVQTDAPSLQVFNSVRHFHQVATVTDIGTFDLVSLNAFAGSGHLYHRDLRSVFPAWETDNDGVDSNCDGFDD